MFRVQRWFCVFCLLLFLFVPVLVRCKGLAALFVLCECDKQSVMRIVLLGLLLDLLLHRKCCCLPFDHRSERKSNVVPARAMKLAGGSAASADADTEWGRAAENEMTDTPFEASGDEERLDGVAIVGGGLAGLAVAIGLQRANIRCRVYERAPELRSVSQGMLSLQPNGLAALERIHPDLPRLVADAGCELMDSVGKDIDADGKIEITMRKPGEETRAQFGRPSVLVQWHALQKVLASLLADKADVVTGRSLRSFKENEESVLLEFGDGSSVRCEAALACDGVFSVARRQISPMDRPIFFGQMNWNAIIPTNKLPPGLHPSETVTSIRYTGEPRWSVFLNDCGGGNTFWQLRVADPGKALALSGSKGRGGLGLAGVKQALLSVVAPSADVTVALNAIPEKQIFERCIIGRSPAARWRSEKGRVALVGDSAHGMHPTIGQGGNSAFESAASVVKFLTKCRENWVAGLRNYEETRRPRADFVQRFANMMGCSQATGEQMLSRELSSQCWDWAKAINEQSPPPQVALALLEKFDPCSQDGVTLL